MRFSAFIKSVSISLVFLFVFFLIRTPAFAQTATIQLTNQPQPYVAQNVNPNVPNNLHTFSQSVMLEVLSALSCNLSGKDLLSNNGQCLGYDPSTGKLGYAPKNGGALQAMSGMIGMLYT